MTTFVLRYEHSDPDRPHREVKVFAGPDEDHVALIGTLRMLWTESVDLNTMLGLGAYHSSNDFIAKVVDNGSAR